MKWVKQGLLYCPDSKVWWSKQYAMYPTPFYMPDKNVIRVFFGTVDENFYGRTSYIDVDADNPTVIKNNPNKYLSLIHIYYISSRAFVWRNVTMGDNVFIFEDNTVQPFVKMGSNIVLWSGNHIGHHSVLGDHLFISSHVVISGFCTVGDYTFMGVNSTVGNNINVGKDCLIGSGCLLVKDTGDGKLYKGTPNKADELSIYEKFNIQ